ncbi:MAG: chloride channel protein, partial [Saprospiraceae bacterium]|nr:chloride channel protein [Saprospiraceae bacterium]
KTLHAIAQKKINIPTYETYAHVITSSLTVGFGGSVGLEAPIVRTGSAIGSNLANLLQVGRKKQALFLACGAAAGMGAIFNSPIGGVIFAFEVLLAEVAIHSFIPLLISSATGAVVAKLLYYEQIFFLPTDGWRVQAIPFYLMIGALCGLVSVYMIRITIRMKTYFSKKDRPLIQVGLGGLALGLMIFLMPPLFGEGYDTINNLLQGKYLALADRSPFYNFLQNEWLLLLFALLILFTKAFATAFTIGLGGNGGVFAPSMFTGAMLGFVFAHAINLTGLVELREANFMAVAMGGLLSGVFKSPLTGIFLIAEITGGYALFVPLMLVSAMAYFVSIYFEPYSVFTTELYRKGLWVPAHERDQRILKNMSVEPLVETNFGAIKPNFTLGEFVKIIAKSNRNVFPVIDKNGYFKGIVLLDDVREIMFDTNLYDTTTVHDIMHNPPAIVELYESMEKVMDKFELHQAWNLPVVDKGRYVGFVSKSTIFNQYRQMLIERSKET